jgi:hypothetical protein
LSATEWELFRLQAIRAAGLEGHPKANEAYSHAWNVAGVYGKDEVLLYLVEYSEIVLGEHHAESFH